MLDMFNSNDWLFKLCHFGSGIDWCYLDEVKVLPWYRFREAVTSASHSSFPTSLPKITQHIITTKSGCPCNVHALTEYLLSFICWILGSAYYKRCNHVHQSFHFCRAGCREWCEWLYYLKEFVTRSSCTYVLTFGVKQQHMLSTLVSLLSLQTTLDLGYQHNLSLAMSSHLWLDPDHPCQLADSCCGS
jgi:hypothetical protein